MTMHPKWYSIPEEYSDRRWTTLNYNGRFVPNYSVSDRGDVFNHRLNIISKKELTHRGYHRVRITPLFEKHNGVNYPLHRAVLMSFEPIPNFKEMQVNHIDGNKINNCLWNLEWVTSKENISHAIITGLRGSWWRNDGPSSVYTTDEVKKICSLIDEGHRDYEIATIMGYPLGHKDRERYGDFVTTVRLGQRWSHISCNYNFYPDNKFNRLREDENLIHTLCKALETNHDYQDIVNQLSIPEEDRELVLELLPRLDNRTIYPEIANRYDLSVPLPNGVKYAESKLVPGVLDIMEPGVYYVEGPEPGVRYYGRKMPPGVRYV